MLIIHCVDEVQIYKNGYGQNWLSGSRGTFLNDSSTLATTAGTTLVGLVKPFAQMSVTTTQPFCADRYVLESKFFIEGMGSILIQYIVCSFYA